MICRKKNQKTKLTMLRLEEQSLLGSILNSLWPLKDLCSTVCNPGLLDLLGKDKQRFDVSLGFPAGQGNPRVQRTAGRGRGLTCVSFSSASVTKKAGIRTCSTRVFPVLGIVRPSRAEALHHHICGPFAIF